MPRWLRSVGAAGCAATMALGLLGGSRALAQDDLTLCALLTEDEVSAAFGGVEMTLDEHATEQACSYSGDGASLTLIYYPDAGDAQSQIDYLHEVSPDIVELEFEGMRALGGPAEVWIFPTPTSELDIGPALYPEGLDIETALTGLAELAAPRLAALLAAREAAKEAARDPELEAMFPSEIAGEAVTVTSQGGRAVTGSVGSGAQAMIDALAAQGKSVEDVWVAQSTGSWGALYAFRVRGGDAAPLLDPIIGLLTGMAPSDVVTGEAQVAGKDATTVTANSRTLYAYPEGEVLWLVAATDPALAEIFQKLP